MLILGNVLSDAESCSSVLGLGLSWVPHRLFDAWNACPGAFLGNWKTTLCIAISMESPEHLWASVFVTLFANLSVLFNKSPKVALNSLTPVPNTNVCLGDPIPSGCPSSFLMFQIQVKQGLSLWLALWFGLGRGVFFLEFPRAASWVCLFPQRFKACPVPWLLGFWAASVSDKKCGGKKNLLSTGCCNLLQMSGQTPSASRCQTTQRWDAEICSLLALLGKGQFRGRSSWELQNRLIFIRNDNKRGVSQGCSKSFICLLPPSALTNAMERISLGFLQEIPYGRVCLCLLQALMLQRENEWLWVNYWQSKSVTALRSSQCMRPHSSSQSWWK